MRNAQRFVNEVIRPLFTLTPLRVLPTAASLAGCGSGGKHTKTPRAWPNGAEALTTYKWIGIGDYTIRA